MGVATPPAHSHPPDRPNQGLTKQQTQPLYTSSSGRPSHSTNVALRFPSKPLIGQLDHAERGVGSCGGRCMGRCRGVSLSSRPQRGSTEKEPEEPERTKNKERTRREKPVLSGWHPVYAVPFGRYPASAVPLGWYLELAVLFWRY